MQTRSIGGSAETEHMELTVWPKHPVAPSVVTTVTALTARLIASTKAVRSAACAGPARMASEGGIDSVPMVMVDPARGDAAHGGDSYQDTPHRTNMVSAT